jgi:chromosomal replication initiation ATPase DnaA
MLQLSLSLQPTNRYSLDYFVSHSGVSEAYSILKEYLASCNTNGRSFLSVYLYGGRGVGKTHLANGFKQELVASGMGEQEIGFLDIRSGDGKSLMLGDDEVSNFIATFERLKSTSGLLIVIANSLPEEVTSNPHFLSRIYHGVLCRIDLPSEEEIVPVICSLAERRNLKLSASSISYLVKHLPRDLLSFDSILARINELPVEGNLGKLAGSNSIRSIVKENC